MTIWLVLGGTYIAGMAAGIALILWAETVSESRHRELPKQTNRNGASDSITSNSGGVR